MINSYLSVGHIKKPYGVKGELKLHIESAYLEDALNADVLFLEIRGKPVPYFVEGFRESSHLLVKFEDVNTPEEAIKLSSKRISLRESDIIPEEERKFIVEDDLQFSKYLGFLLTDEKLGAIGTIQSIEEYPQQEMAVIEYKGKEILIPLHDDLIQSIQEEEKKITIALPDGLLEL